MKLFYIEQRVHGYILGAGTVLYMAGLLRYIRINNIASIERPLSLRQTSGLCSIGQLPHVNRFEALSLVGFRPCKFILGA